ATVSDVKAGGPDVWKSLKASLLGELYVKTLNVLEEMEKGEFQREDVRAVLRRIQSRIRRELAKDYPGNRVDHFLETMPERYFLSTAKSDTPAHFELMEKFTGNGTITAVEHFPERDCSSVAICTQDRPRLFASITKTLTALNLDILNAKIFTSHDGRVLDVFRISHQERSELVMAKQKWNKFRSTLNDVLKG